MTDMLPPELLSQIFYLLAQEKVKRSTFRTYREGCHLAPSLQSSSQVSRGWRDLLLGDGATRTRATVLRFRIDWQSLKQPQKTREMTQNHPSCPILVYLDLCDNKARPAKIEALLIRLFDTYDLADRLQAIEIVCYDSLVRHKISTAFANRTFLNLQYIGLAVHDPIWWDIAAEDIALESPTILSGSMFPRIVAEDDPWRLVFSELKDLTGIRILDCGLTPTCSEFRAILKFNPELQSLAIQKDGIHSTGSLALGETEVAGISLPRLTKCFLAAHAPCIWQFLSCPGINKLRHLSLSVKALHEYKSISAPVPTSDLSRLVYLSLQPLCAVTASFLAVAGLHCLKNLNFTPYKPAAGLTLEQYDCSLGSDEWPIFISLRALTTLRVAGAKAAYVDLFLRALAKGTECAASHPLTSFTLDLTVWGSESYPGSEALQSVFQEAIFRNITTLSIEQDGWVLQARFLWGILNAMPNVIHLYLSQTWDCDHILALPLVCQCEPPEPSILSQLTLLEINMSQQSETEDPSEYISSSDEAELVELLRFRFDLNQQSDDIDLDVLRLRVHPALRGDAIAEIEGMKCSVEDNVDFSYRLSAVEEFEDL